MQLKVLLICLLFLPAKLYCQLVNNGEKISVGTDALLSVQGDYSHLAGAVSGSGTMLVNGNWYNYSTQFPRVFDVAEMVKVLLGGADQKIGGTTYTSFPFLTLGGSGKKRMDIDLQVQQALDLQGLELVTGSSTATVMNADERAVLRTTGFVNTDEKGQLERKMTTTGWYLFPMGSSTAARYRPVMIQAKNASSNTFGVKLINSDPNTAGLNRNSKRENVNNISDKFYFSIAQKEGTATADMRFYSSSTSDGDVDQLVRWEGGRIWEKAAPSSRSIGTFNDGLDRYLLLSTTSALVGEMPVAFANTNTTDQLVIFNAFSPNGDGKNDRWEVKNLDLYPDNDLSIYNRWGDVIFTSKSYNKAKAWDGGTFNSGTYFYVLRVMINGEQKVFKGAITMIKDK